MDARATSGSTRDAPEVGDVIGPVEVGPIAHGGHCVARHDGRVIFTRHALPGESVLIRITDTSHARFFRGDAVQVLRAADERVEPACPVSGPGQCGGCDFQHVAADHQRELKRRVIVEQLQRLAGLDWTGVVERVGQEWAAEPPRWRTRMRWHHEERAGWGLRAHRSHRVVGLPERGCLIAAEGVPRPTAEGDEAYGVLAHASESALLVDGVVASHHDHAGHPVSADVVTQVAAGRHYAVAIEGFWQVHPAAADTLVGAVLDVLDPRAGERALDLYCGVGLFAGALSDRGVAVHGVESGRRAVALARSNVPEATFEAGRVDRVLPRLRGRPDLVVLDPPRRGAGRAVMTDLLRRGPRRIAYVACDPASLARDLRIATDAGWQVTGVRAFDLFPMTHHVECLALLEPPDPRMVS